MKRKIQKLIVKYRKNKIKKECEHGFEMLDVVNLNIDPKCFWCERPLSEITKEKALLSNKK